MTDALEYNPSSAAGVFVLLHGLGATGADLYPLAEHICGGELRVVCPHAPVRAITINGGIAMPAWYDIAGPDLSDRQDENGIKESAKMIREFINAEIARGVASSKIFLGGFSQGAALSLYAGVRYPKPLAGIVVMSGYMLRAETFAKESAKENLQTPIFQSHGEYDPVVLPEWARQCRDTLRAANRPLLYKEYPAPHAIPPQTTTDLSNWMQKILVER